MTESMHWASVWGNAVSISEHRPETYSKNITLRYPIYCQFGGDAIRLTFDNYCGTEAITIHKATVNIEGIFYPITFQGGAHSVTIPAGERIVTDEVHISIPSQSTIRVSFYLADFTLMRSAVFTCGPLSEGTFAVGDQTECTDIDINISRPTHMFYFLSNVSVHTSTQNRTVICYGDSITAQDWPDYLSLRCKEQFPNTAIIRRATSGSRILREYNCITYESYGLMGDRRFDHEVPTDGADTVIIQQGINDIIHPVGVEVNPFRPMSDLPSVEELIEGLKTYIAKARSYGYKVYVGTLLPIKGWRTYAPFREEMRNSYNDWIRTTDLIDGCIDFDKAVCDPEIPEAFASHFDSGDHLHPSKKGYQQMAETVPVELLR